MPDWLAGFFETPVDDLGDDAQHMFFGVDDLDLLDQPVKALRGGNDAEQLVCLRVGHRLDFREVNDNRIARRNGVGHVVAHPGRSLT
ncbi:MAG: hypothetical protein ACYDHM_09490 [Acidiferrobacterales bacterium]